MQQIDHSKNIIELKNISFSYGRNEVLKDISLDIHRGDYLGVVGSNGAGKTTLLKIMLGLIKSDKGSIRFFGKDINEFKEWSKVGYVPQKAVSFDINFPATVSEVVLMGRFGKRGLFHGMTAEDGKAVREALQRVEMWEHRNRLIGDLSGGEQQRVFIARALCGEPEIIFLDEPTTGIDQQSEDDFYALLRRLNKELGITLVLVTHDISRITVEAMHIACIEKTLVCHTSPEEYLKESHSREVLGEKVKIMTHHHH